MQCKIVTVSLHLNFKKQRNYTPLHLYKRYDTEYLWSKNMITVNKMHGKNVKSKYDISTEFRT